MKSWWLQRKRCDYESRTHICCCFCKGGSNGVAVCPGPFHWQRWPLTCSGYSPQSLATISYILNHLFPLFYLQFNITKLQLLEAEKAKVRREYERREGTIEVKKKVEYSKQLNASRIKILQAREDAVQSILGDAQGHMMKLSSDKAAYSRLLQDLMVQAVSKLADTKVLVRCREVDTELVRSLLPQVAAACTQKRAGGGTVSVELDTAHPLAPPPSGGKAEEFDTW